MQRVSRTRHLIILACLSLLTCSSATAQPKIVFETDSKFNHITVQDTDKGERELIFGDGAAVQSAVRPGQPGELCLPYLRVAMCGLAIMPQPQHVLIVGLGGGSMPMFLRRVWPNLTIDVAELDPVVVEVASRFFDFRTDPKLRVHVGDGRAFIERTRTQYDIVFLDAYGEDSIPYALATKQFLQAVKRIISPKGLVVANLWSSSVNELYPSMLKTYAEVFPERHILRVGEKANRILLALPRRDGLTKQDLVRKAGELRGPLLTKLRLAATIESGYEQRPRIRGNARVLLDKPEAQTQPAQETQPTQDTPPAQEAQPAVK